jgi:multidrug efflux pump subunit AcrA (membrane-fusion protein)
MGQPTHGHNDSYTPADRMTAMRLINQPQYTRWLARMLIVFLLITPFVLLLLPWQQNVYAAGRIIAYDPVYRQQDIEAPIDGRIQKLYVKEGDRVKAGQVLVEIRDPDSLLLSRLKLQKDAIDERIKAAKQRQDSFLKQVNALVISQKQGIEAAKNRLEGSKQRLEGARESLTIAGISQDQAMIAYRVQSNLYKDGLTPELTFINAKLRRDSTIADQRRAVNTVESGEAEVKTLTADLAKVETDIEASISSAKASQQGADAELASAVRDLEMMNVQISRQQSQIVMAPHDGVVHRVLANGDLGGTLVKNGDRLMTITPTIPNKADRVVELFLDGNDAPQLTEYWRQKLRRQQEAVENDEYIEGDEIKVRIQFEGWPAVQWIGWPSLAWGTFGGTVMFVDPHDDGKGRFRILVKPDPNPEAEDHAEWPSQYSLRQGARAQAWVLLDKVSIGFELWRRFNGFPPVIAPKDGEEKAKPAKLRVPK